MIFKKSNRVLPGFGLTLGVTVTLLSLVVLVPLSTLFFKTSTMGWDAFLETVRAPRVLAAIRLTFGASLLAALVNSFFGLIVAWILVRYNFPAKKWVDGMVDLPFALPTAVAGITLTSLYSKSGWLGRPLEAIGIKTAYTPLGIVVALTFI